MARRGPKPKTVPPEQVAESDDLRYLPGMSKRAREVWDRDLAVFRDKLVSRSDETAFGGYCQTRAEIEDLEKHLGRLTGEAKYFVVNGYGSKSENPLWRTLDRLRKLELNYLKELGLTPAARRKASKDGPPAAPPQVVPDAVALRRQRLLARMSGGQA